MKSNNLKGSLILCLTAFIWGIAFVAQSDGGELVPSLTFNALRSFIAAGSLYIFYKITSGRKEKHFFPEEKPIKKQYLTAALVCGLLLAISVNLQQFGISAYPAGAAAEARSGFITALYVVFVPIISLLFGKKVNPIIYLSVLIAVGGFYLLCFSGGISGIYLADILVFVCALSFACQIIAVGHFVNVTGGLKLSILQFTVVGILSTAAALIFERPVLSNILSAAPQIIYLGVVSSGIGYTLQIVGQKYAEPSVASLTMSLESVFAALGGWLISGNVLSVREFIGCAVVFAAIITAQLPEMLAGKKADIKE